MNIVKDIKRSVLFGLVCLLANFSVAKAGQPMKLWYTQPASEWMKSLPVGNGRLGAMVFGGIEKETIALNEITLWAGKEDPDQDPLFGKEKLQQIRTSFFRNDLIKGNDQAQQEMAGKPHSFGTHLPVGNLNLHFDSPDGGQITDYERELNLEDAIVRMSYNRGGVHYTREVFCSNPDGVLVIKCTASRPSSLHFSLSLDLLRKAKLNLNKNVLEFSGDLAEENPQNGGVKFLGNITVKTDDGIVSEENHQLKVKNATSAYIYIDIRTNFKSVDYENICRTTVQKAASKDFDALKTSHIADYKKLYDRVELSFGKSDNDNLPTDLRWLLVKEGKNDVGLDALFFQYARYLLIASSRENSPLPANLQGVWNDNLANNMGWTCDYHMDINTEQNYWLANVGNLGECNLPLFRFLKNLSEYGKKTARDVYGARGWTAHTMVNAWGFTAPGWHVGWGLFPTGGTWLASHLWTHYAYTHDKEFLRNDAYPVLKSSAEFFMDYMTVDPKTGYWVTGPSTSPENGFSFENKGISLSMMPTVDRVLVADLFQSVIQAAKILNTDKKFADSLQLRLAKFPPLMISKKYGGVQEWMEDYDEAYRNHRHTSHLVALYPLNQISLDETPDLAKAAKQTLVRRLTDPNWEDTEWSRANMICFNARLKNAEEAYQSVVQLQRNFTRENLMTISPKGIAGAPYDIFIFDGNEAGAAGIAEMLIQSQNGYIEFLPALPGAWKTGHFKGLCVQGGGEADLEWKDGKVLSAMIKATSDQVFKIRWNETLIPELKKNGKIVMLKQKDNGFIEFGLKKGEEMNLTYRYN